MFTKSIIQQKLEAEQLKYDFMASIENLMEKYNIEDSVFVFKNGAMREVVDGYFVTEHEFDNIKDAIAECDIATMGIRIIGTTFQTGTINSKLSECVDNKKVLDIGRLIDIR